MLLEGIESEFRTLPIAELWELLRMLKRGGRKQVCLRTVCIASTSYVTALMCL